MIRVCHAFLSVHCCLVVSYWERAGLLALLYVLFYCIFVTFPCGVLGQVWYLYRFLIFASLLILLRMCDTYQLVYFKDYLIDFTDKTFYVENCTTVLPAKSDSDHMFCLQSYQGLIINRSLVYPQDRINTQVVYRFALAQEECTS